ncbi:MAG: hypothetical protein Q9225_005402 [Loekoesia sp. 1 TL-2023]
MSESFAYASLPGEGWMRLLSFDSLHESDINEIHCILSGHRINDQLEYSALSYTWGPPKASNSSNDVSKEPYYKNSRQIYVNASPFLVTSNLHDALARLRHWRADILLWVDAICINQDDLTERNLQVNAMSEIYGNSSEVIVWLGEEDSGTKQTVDLIQNIALAAKTRDTEGRLINQQHLGHWAFQDPRALASVGLPPITQDQWRNLVQLYNRRWFERLWVVQEIALPRQTTWKWMASTDTSPIDGYEIDSWATWTSGSAQISQRREAIRILCGSSEVPWEELLECSLFLEGTGIATGLLELNPPRPDLHNETIVTSALHLLCIIRTLCQGKFIVRHAAVGLTATRDVAAWNRAFNLKEDDYDASAYFCLLQFLLRSWKCTDPRDKIFSLIGIIDRTSAAIGSRKPPLVVADYSKSVEEVYWKTTQVILQNMQRLDLLLMIPDPADRRYSELPSWVKDYSVKGPIPLTLYGHEQEDTSHFNAAKGYEKVDLSFCSNNRALRLRGLKLGQITDAGEAVDEWGQKRSFEASATLAMKCDEIYINGQSRLEALWRTIITDQTSTNHPAPAMVGTLFFQYLRALFRHAIFGQLFASAENANVGEEVRTELEPSPNVNKLAESDPSGQMPAMYGDLESAVERMREGLTFNEIIEIEDAAYKKSIELFYPYMNIPLRMRLFRTENSLLGMGPKSVSKGDEAWVLQGARVPFVLRPNLDTRRYQLIGQAYVHGMMQGEALGGGDPLWMDVEIE